MYSRLSGLIIVLTLWLWSTCNSVVTQSPASSLLSAVPSPHPILSQNSESNALKLNTCRWGWKLSLSLKLFRFWSCHICWNVCKFIDDCLCKYLPLDWSFCALLQFQQDIAGTLEWPRTGQGWVLNLQGEVARRYLRLNGENMQMNFCPLCNVPKFLVTRFCKTETGS